MTKFKRLTLCGLVCLFAMGIGLCAVGCVDDKQNATDKKYDVTIKLKNNFGSEWIFTPDIKELTYEFEYTTGEEMWFYVDSYNLSDHPKWGEKWFTPDRSGPNIFSGSILYGDGENWLYEVDKVCERGSYSVAIYSHSTSNLWNYRSIRLYVTVI